MKKLLKIVHLEDVEEDADMVSFVLKKSGIAHLLLHTDNREDFTRALHVFSPDIVLSDHSLPSFNSHDALQLVKGTNRIIPFILVTATVSEEYAVSILKDGAADYILKDRLQRLPAAVISAVEKIEMEKAIIAQRLQQEKLLLEKGLSAQEKERNDIGQELHDNINQVLAAAKLYLQAGIHKNKLLGDTGLFEKSQEYITMAIREIRSLSHTLITPPLDVLTFTESVEGLIEAVRRTTAIKIKVTDLQLAEELLQGKTSLMFFRIIQEQLSNILKHAQAKNIAINFWQDNAILMLAITDDGIGFNPAENTGGIGLRNISNRAACYDGKMNIVSSPGNGCTLEIALPLKKMTLPWLRAV
jgi:signal transduction histidine kinase